MLQRRLPVRGRALRPAGPDLDWARSSPAPSSGRMAYDLIAEPRTTYGTIATSHRARHTEEECTVFGLVRGGQPWCGTRYRFPDPAPSGWLPATWWLSPPQSTAPMASSGAGSTLSSWTPPAGSSGSGSQSTGRSLPSGETRSRCTDREAGRTSRPGCRARWWVAGAAVDSTWYVCCGVSAITASTCCMNVTGTFAWNRSLMLLTNTNFGVSHEYAAPERPGTSSPRTQGLSLIH